MEQMKRTVAAMNDVDIKMPPPPTLKRETTMSILPGHPSLPSMMEVDEEMVLRYLQYECNYRACKYRDPILTWGDIREQDYPEFVKLLSYHVPLTSNTFLALESQLLPSDKFKARMAVRERDTPLGQEKECIEYLKYVCTHKGRMNGKTWAEIRATEYSYFVWAVGNTMSRETKTFNIMKNCLTLAHQRYVLKTAKGAVKVRKGLIYQESVF